MFKERRAERAERARQAERDRQDLRRFMVEAIADAPCEGKEQLQADILALHDRAESTLDLDLLRFLGLLTDTFQPRFYRDEESVLAVAVLVLKASECRKSLRWKGDLRASLDRLMEAQRQVMLART